jgi:hypothetical protein
MGVVNAILVLPLTDACEMETTEKNYEQVPQDEHDQVGSAELRDVPLSDAPPNTSPSWLGKTQSWFTNHFTHISAQTRSIMYKLWFLLAVDSLADGMVPYSLTNYYMDKKFHPAKSTLGDVTSVSYFLAAIGSTFAGPLARKIGLINTMVFTHVPSSSAVLLFPFPPYLWMTAGLLFVRAGLNNMDQAPRSAFIAAVVKPEERTAVMGITSMLRTLAAMSGPTVTGLLAASGKFWIAFVAAGMCRLAYDFGLYALFVNMKLHQHEAEPTQGASGEGNARRSADIAEDVEMQSLAESDSIVSDDSGYGPHSKQPSKNGGLNLPDPVPARLRSRSPHRITGVE